ncbi:MAG: signal peptide peptidase SppA [Chromatiales bacterium]|nr:signal peptide peptidase SppA [Chromatiales bacterium]
MRIIGLWLKALWRGLDTLRRILHLVLLLPLFVLFLAALIGDRQPLPDRAALVLSPTGLLVEQLEGDPFDRALQEFQGSAPRQTLLRDVLESLELAAADDRIGLVVLSLDQVQGGGLSKLQQVADAIMKIRAAGKPVIATGSGFSQAQYYLAAHADEILMHEFGVVFIDGFGYYRTFFASALEKLSIDMNVFRVGEYKSFVEPWTRDDMSAEDREASRRWLDELWGLWQQDVTVARALPGDAIARYAEGFRAGLERAGGDTARLALDAGLVDRLMSRPEMEEYLAQQLAMGQPAGRDFERLDFRSYLRAMRRDTHMRRDTQAPTGSGDVGVIVASGVIIDGRAAPGTIGGDSLAALIRRAGEDDTIRALVLRIDSPGGSMFASEVIAEEVERVQASGKPVVASLGSVAASGGYYIALPTDEIWASPATITGSIGVGAIFPTVQRSLERLGIHVDGIGTTPLSGQLRLDRELGEEASEILELTVREAYRLFVAKVAQYRQMSWERADNVARGRVWSGSDALDLGLVDGLGELDEAIAAAARRAGLEPDRFTVRYIEPELSLGQRLLVQFGGASQQLAVRLGLVSEKGVRTSRPSEHILAELRQRLDQELAMIARFNDPRGLYYHCFCVSPH